MDESREKSGSTISLGHRFGRIITSGGRIMAVAKHFAMSPMGGCQASLGVWVGWPSWGPCWPCWARGLPACWLSVCLHGCTRLGGAMVHLGSQEWEPAGQGGAQHGRHSWAPLPRVPLLVPTTLPHTTLLPRHGPREEVGAQSRIEGWPHNVISRLTKVRIWFHHLWWARALLHPRHVFF